MPARVFVEIHTDNPIGLGQKRLEHKAGAAGDIQDNPPWGPKGGQNEALFAQKITVVSVAVGTRAAGSESPPQ